MPRKRESTQARSNFRYIAAGGVLFQGGAAAIDTSTIVAGLVHGLTGSRMKLDGLLTHSAA